MSSLYYLRSGADIYRMLCTVDELGSFTMMIFNINQQPFVTRFDPARTINETYTKPAEWWNAGIAVNYRWSAATSTLFTVPQPDGQHMVFLEDYHIPRKIMYGNNLLRFIALKDYILRVFDVPANLTSGATIHPMPTQIDMTDWSDNSAVCNGFIASTLNDTIFILCPGSQSRLLSRSSLRPAKSTLPDVPIIGGLGVAIPSSSAADGDWANYPHFAFVEFYDSSGHLKLQRLSSISFTGNDSSVLTSGVSHLSIPEDYGLRDITWGSRDPVGLDDDMATVGLMVGVLINGLTILLLCGIYSFRRCCFRMEPKHNVNPKDGDDEEEESNSSDDGTRRDAESEMDDTTETLSQKQPENDGVEFQAYTLVSGKVEDETGGRGKERSVREAMDNDAEITLSSIQQSTALDGTRSQSDDIIPMSVIIGPVAAPMVVSSPSSSQHVAVLSTDTGINRTRRQKIVLANHPRPNIVMTIAQSSSTDDMEAEDGEGDEVVEEWLPRPFDPRSHVLTHTPPPPQQLVEVTSTIAEPSAPPEPRPTISEVVDDDEDPLPLYSPISKSHTLLR
ncbi:hypothetical protein BGW42_002856 [Actinomortierella wolfii]|nr:hypothetical protein BGW42_002856 [Actinomortierella wolfii]